MESLRRRNRWMYVSTTALIWMLATFGSNPPSDIPANPVPDSISDNAMTFNAMTFNALMMHPNEELADYSLEEVAAPGSVFEVDLATDPYAREFMHYLVSCALPEGVELAWSSGPKTETWEGALGLCPSWETDAPGQDCQELVSACLLARVNAYGVSVPISLRGLDLANDPLPMSQDESLDFVWQEGAFYGNIFCEDCIDPGVNMFVLNGVLFYRMASRIDPRRTMDVACDSFEGRSEGEVRRLRDQCHTRFLQATRYVGVVYKAMFACWSPVWADGEARTRSRICAGSATSNDTVSDQKLCAAWPVGACYTASQAVPCQTDHICDVADSAPRAKDGDVDECAGMPMASDALPLPGTCPAPPPSSAPTWHHPLTVFLDQPCAIVPEQDGCRLNPAIIDPTTGGPRWPIEETTQPR